MRPPMVMMVMPLLVPLKKLGQRRIVDIVMSKIRLAEDLFCVLFPAQKLVADHKRQHKHPAYYKSDHQHGLVQWEERRFKVIMLPEITTNQRSASVI